MTVHVITDSSSCLPKELAEAEGVTVLDLYTSGQGAEKTTAGLGALELTANYARLLERSGDEGVVALHLSKELSSTWSNAVTAAGVLEGKVRVVDTNTAGMALGYAAIEAARVARAGGSLDEVAEAADRVLNTATLWLYVHKIDSLRRGGRLSTGRTLLTTALAIKPILKLADGELQLAAKTRTQAKAMAKLVAMTCEAVRDEAEAAVREHRDVRRMKIAIQQSEAVEPAKHLSQMIADGLAELEEQLEQEAQAEPAKAAKAKGAKANAKSGAKNAKSSKNAKDKGLKGSKSKAGKHGEREQAAEPSGAEEAEDAAATGASEEAVAAEQESVQAAAPKLVLPDVDIELFEVSPGIAVHTGPGAIGVAVVCE